VTLDADPSGPRGCARGRAHNVGRRMNTPVADQSPVRGSEGPVRERTPLPQLPYHPDTEGSQDLTL
jgi:hypothetical protein